MVLQAACHKEQTQTRKTEFLFAQAKTTSVGNLLSASLVGSIYWSTMNNTVLICWLIAEIVILTARWDLANRFKCRDRYASAEQWRRAYDWNALLNGCAWGAMFVYASHSLSTAQLTGFIAILGALVAASTIAYNSCLKTYFSFVVPALFPATAYLLLFGISDKLALTAVACSWFALMVSFARQLNRHVDLNSAYETRNLELLRELDKWRQASLLLQEEIALKGEIIDRLLMDDSRQALQS